MDNQQRTEIIAEVVRNLSFIPISADLYSELDEWSRRDGGSGGPGAIASVVEHQLRFFLKRMYEVAPIKKVGKSLYWQDPNSGVTVELPHSTELRTHYYYESKVAVVDNGKIEWNGKTYSSPSKVCNAMRGGTNNNAWKEFEIKRPTDPQFLPANGFRPDA